MAGGTVERWSLIDEVRLAPTVAIVGPGELWLCGGPREVIHEIAALEIEEGWTEHGTGDVETNPALEERARIWLIGWLHTESRRGGDD